MTAGVGVEVRPLERGQNAAWLSLWRGYQAFYKVEIPAEVSRVTWERLLDPAEPVGGALAWEGKLAVGLVHHIRHRSSSTAGDDCYLQDLFVAPEIRGRGIGRRLIEYVYETAARDGCVRVYWLTHETNQVAMRLYDSIAERTGFIQHRRNLGPDVLVRQGEATPSPRQRERGGYGGLAAADPH